MPRRAVIVGLALSSLVASVLAGCVNNRTRLLEEFNDKPAADMEQVQTPRVSRMQATAQSQPIPPGGEAGSAPTAYHLRVRAWVNGQPLFDDEIRQAIFPEIMRLQRMPEPERSKRLAELFNFVLDQFIERELLYQDAMHKLRDANPKALQKLKEIAKKEFDKKTQKIMRDNKLSEEEFREQLRRQGMSLQSMERQEERKFFADEFLRSRIFPYIERGSGHRQVLEYYETHLSEFRKVDSVKWQDIFIAVGPKHPTREQAGQFAASLIQRLQQGEDFKNLLQYDDGLSHYNNGDGTGHRKGEIQPPQVEAHLFNMKDGDVGPLVEMDTGFHVFRLVQREYEGQIPYTNEVQKMIRNKLRNEIADRESKRILKELRSRAIIQIEKD